MSRSINVTLRTWSLVLDRMVTVLNGQLPTLLTTFVLVYLLLQTSLTTIKVWEHYSSIRNLDGPHTGLPCVQERALSVEEEQRQKDKLAQTPHVMPWMIDVVASSLPYLADRPTIKKTLEEFRGNVNAAVDKLLGAEESGSQSSAQESSSVEREPDSDEEYQRGPSKKQDRRISVRQRSRRSESAQLSSKLATCNDSQDSFTSVKSEDTDASSSKGIKSENTDDSPAENLPKPKIRIKLKPPAPPSSPDTTTNGKTQQKQQGLQRQTAREKKDIKKQAQKAARKERQQAAINAGDANATVKNGIALRTKGMTNTPPIESGFRTLFI